MIKKKFMLLVILTITIIGTIYIPAFAKESVRQVTPLRINFSLTTTNYLSNNQTFDIYVGHSLVGRINASTPNVAFPNTTNDNSPKSIHHYDFSSSANVNGDYHKITIKYYKNNVLVKSFKFSTTQIAPTLNLFYDFDNKNVTE